MMQQAIHVQLAGCTTIQAPRPLHPFLVPDQTGGRLLRRARLQVAHRLDSVMRADRVAVMEGGRVIESGVPGELLRDGASHFACMQAAQSGQPSAGC